jgi:putative hydrolase of the HAD superfamily
MAETLGYSDLFQGQYYSYRLGAAKPDAAYFRAILADLELAPEDVLFIDDNEKNVSSAREVGLRAALFSSDPPRSVQTLRLILSEHQIDWRTE